MIEARAVAYAPRALAFSLHPATSRFSTLATWGAACGDGQLGPRHVALAWRMAAFTLTASQAVVAGGLFAEVDPETCNACGSWWLLPSLISIAQNRRKSNARLTIASKASGLSGGVRPSATPSQEVQVALAWREVGMPVEFDGASPAGKPPAAMVAIPARLGGLAGEKISLPCNRFRRQPGGSCRPANPKALQNASRRVTVCSLWLGGGRHTRHGTRVSGRY